MIVYPYLIWIYFAPRGHVKSDKLLDHLLQCEPITQHQNLFAIVYCTCRLISHHEHNIIRENIHS